MTISQAQRRALKARAHKLKPVVQTGANGVSQAVLDETDLALAHHELIKVRLAGADRDQRRDMADHFCKKLGADEVGLIGNVLILYRPVPGD